MPAPRRTSNANTPRRAAAARGGALVVTVVVEPPPWLRAACAALVQIAATLDKQTRAPAPVLPLDVRATPAFSRRNALAQRQALARREAVAAFYAARARGSTVAASLTEARAAFLRFTGSPCSGRAICHWEARVRAGGGIARAPLDVFLDRKTVPHPRARKHKRTVK